jgi:hypothetical protein
VAESQRMKEGMDTPTAEGGKEEAAGWCSEQGKRA